MNRTSDSDGEGTDVDIEPPMHIVGEIDEPLPIDLKIVSTNLIEVRTFLSWEEISSLNGYQPDNAVTKQNYKRIRGDYDFEEEVKCCYLKDNGKLCYEDHKRGFVVELHDSSITIIGNTCAKDKFGLESDFRRDSAKYENEKRRREKFASLFALVDQEPAILQSLTDACSRISIVEERMLAFRGLLGTETLQRLDSMRKTGNPQVVVNGIKRREYIDEWGRRKVESTRFPIRIGSIPHLKLFDTYQYVRLQDLAASIKHHFPRARALPANAKVTDVEALVSQLNRHTEIINAAESLERDAELFFGETHFALCYLARDKVERFKMARMVNRESGLSKEAAKLWLAKADRRFADESNTDAIEIQ